jgi:DNA-directed RNA polymerase subunit RPC12/RpoP
MKSRLDKTMELVEGKKQTTLFAAEPVAEGEEPVREQKKKSINTRKTTYWACEKGHIFRHNFAVAKDRAKVGLRCPECGSKAKNRVNENTYIQYRKKTGRMDEKEYRMKQAKEASVAVIQSKVVSQKKDMQPKKESRMVDIQPFREAMDQGAVLQVYKKNGKLVMEATPVFSKWLLYSVIINALMLAILITKITGLW